MEKNIAEIGDLILKLEDEMLRFERECECKKPDCHKQLKARHLKEQIIILDNERGELLKEKINNRPNNNFSHDKKSKEEFDQEKQMHNQFSEKKETDKDYSSFTAIRGRRKFGETCFDCGAGGKMKMIIYTECGKCGERIEGDSN